jgi:hypothetical protein
MSGMGSDLDQALPQRPDGSAEVRRAPGGPGHRGEREPGRLAAGHGDLQGEAFADVSSELGAEIDPAWRRANFMVSGIDLRESRGRVLDIGGVRVRLTGETRPCEQMDEAFQGLRAALRPEWRGGAFGEVLNDGAVAIGSVVGFIEETE